MVSQIELFCTPRLRDAGAFRGGADTAGLVPWRRSRQSQPRPVTGGSHGDLGVVVAVPGHFRRAKPPVERVRPAVDREYVENRVLAFVLCSIYKRADDPVPMPWP
jgi:hypothetical protein